VLTATDLQGDQRLRGSAPRRLVRGLHRLTLHEVTRRPSHAPRWAAGRVSRRFRRTDRCSRGTGPILRPSRRPRAAGRGLFVRAPPAAKRPRARLHATLQFALCLGEAGNSDDAHRVLSSALKTCAALELSQVLLDEGPQMLRLAKDAVDAKEFSSADPTTAANVRDFVSNLVEKSSV